MSDTETDLNLAITWFADEPIDFEPDLTTNMNPWTSNLQPDSQIPISIRNAPEVLENTAEGPALSRGNYLDQGSDREKGLLQEGLATAPTSLDLFSPLLGPALSRGNYLDQGRDREIGLLQGGLATAPTSLDPFSPLLVPVGLSCHSTAAGGGP